MKKLCSKWGACLFLVMASVCYAQSQQRQMGLEKSFDLYVSDVKTTNVVFPYAIVGVDRGTPEVLAQKAAGVDNILQVKAAVTGMAETNISVVTADGQLTTFIVRYQHDPESVNVTIGPGAKTTGGNSLFVPAGNINEAVVRENAQLVDLNPLKKPRIVAAANDIELKMNGIYIHGNLIYFRFDLTNRSNINYDIEQLRFAIRDQKKAKRTAHQELEVTPVFANNQSTTVEGLQRRTLVFAVPKFTIPDKKYLNVQLMEQNGGRHLDMKLKNRHILMAVPIQ